MKLQNVRSITDPTVIPQFDLKMFAGKTLSPDEVRHLLELCGALWTHSGDPYTPHAELTSGHCSDGFVDVLWATCWPNICCIFADQLVRKSGVDCLTADSRISWVVGSDHAGATISFAVAEMLRVKHDFTEKVLNTSAGGKAQAWKRFTIDPSDIVLQVEDLVPTAKTIVAVRNALQDAHPDHIVRFAPVVLTVVNRSGLQVYKRIKIVSLLDLDIKTWSPKNCPLCKRGSKRLRPKQNWTELTGGAE